MSVVIFDFTRNCGVSGGLVEALGQGGSLEASCDPARGVFAGSATAGLFVWTVFLFGYLGITRRMDAAREASASKVDLDALAKLAELRERGVLTEDELQAKKRELLGP